MTLPGMNNGTVVSMSFVVWSLVCSSSVCGDVPNTIRHDEQRVFRRAVARASAFVVRIDTIGGAQPPTVATATPAGGDREDGTPPQPTPFRDSLGSRFLVADGPTTGIVYSSDGWILASSFNFVREPAHITVRLADGRRFVATIVARDKVRKLALLKIDATDLEVPEWVPTDDIRVGQQAIALGRGFGGDTPSVTVGIVSALNRMMGNAIQTDASLSPATYGGPLIDLSGRVLGICVPMAQRPGELAGVEFYDAGIGFAVPHHRVETIVEALKRGQSFHRGWLGVRIDPRSSKGLRIRKLADPSPVRALGIRADDEIIEANGHEVRNFANLVQAIYMVPAGEMVRLLVRRDKLVSGYEVVLARSDELGPLVDDEPVVDPDNPFPLPSPYPWP